MKQPVLTRITKERSDPESRRDHSGGSACHPRRPAWLAQKAHKTMSKFLRNFFFTPLENDSEFQSIVVRTIAVALAGLAVIALLVGLAQNNTIATIVLGLAVIRDLHRPDSGSPGIDLVGTDFGAQCAVNGVRLHRFQHTQHS